MVGRGGGLRSVWQVSRCAKVADNSKGGVCGVMVDNGDTSTVYHRTTNNSHSCQAHLGKEGSSPSKVVLCAPGKTSDIPMYVYGVNHDDYVPNASIISNASCTTNCLAPVCKVLQQRFGVVNGLMTTVHATTATQSTVDGPSKKDRRRGRAAAHNIFPTSSGAAKAVAKVVPGLDGKLTGLAVRIPPTNGSLVDLSVILEKPTPYEEVMAALKEASQVAVAEGGLQGVMGWTDEELVSTDIIRSPLSGVVDSRAGLQVAPNFMKIIVWYVVVMSRGVDV